MRSRPARRPAGPHDFDRGLLQSRTMARIRPERSRDGVSRHSWVQFVRGYGE